MTTERKRTGRHVLRLELKRLREENLLLTQRLVETTNELKLHGLWCGLGRPSWLRRQFNALWTRLTFATHPTS